MWPVTVITFLEGLRNRVLLGIFILAILSMALSIVFSTFFMQEISKVVIDFNLSAISLAGLLIALSLSINLLAKDLERRTIYFVLSRQISRPHYIFGKFLGIILLTLFAYLILLAISIGVILTLESVYPRHFNTWAWIPYMQAVYFDFVKICLFNAIIIFFSTVTSSSFITMLLSIAVYIAGQTISEVVNFLSLNTQNARPVEISDTLQVIISITKYLIPNFSAFDFKVIAAHGILINSSEFLTFSAYGMGYTFIMLFLASYAFSRKELL